MSRIAKRTLSIFLDSLSLKMATVILFFFLIFPSLKEEMDDIVKIILLWGGIQFGYDLFTKRTFLRAKNVIWLTVFLAMEIVTIVLNFPTGIKNNVSLFCYTAVAMLVLYPNDQEKDTQRLIKEMRLLGLTYVILCAIASMISLIIFAVQYNNELVYANTLYYTGVYEGRLWGIYSNPNFPAAMIAAALALILIPICKKTTENIKVRRFQYGIVTVCFFLNFWYMVLAQSRGSIISFMVFLCVYCFYLFRKKIFYTLKNISASIILSIVSSICILGIVYLGMSCLLSASNALPMAFSRYDSEQSASGIQKLQANSSDMEEDIGRDVEQEQKSMVTGRTVIWKQGWDKFLKKPLFGYGNVGSTKGVKLHPTDDIDVKHFHNVVMQSLVADGLAGTIPLTVFAAFSLAAMARYAYRHRKDNWDSVGILCGCFALIALYIANNMIEIFVVYSVSIPNFLFWIILGYIMSLMSRNQPDSNRNIKLSFRSNEIMEDRTV